MYGWVGKILRVDLSSEEIEEIPTTNYVPKFLGGRGLGAKIVWDEVPSQVNAFDPDNRLIFVTGPLQGTMAPTSGRFIVCGKSPQTAPVESYTRSAIGGHWAPELKWAGYDALIVQGKARRPVYIWIHDGAVQIRDARNLWGLNTYDTQKALWSIHGQDTRVMVIGKAGENKSRIAIILTDTGDAAGQGGFGGVMGSKNLKAIAVRGTNYVRVARPKELMEIVHYCNQLFSRKPAGADPYIPSESGFLYNIWGGNPRGALTMDPRKSLLMGRGELLDLCNDPTSGYTKIPDGCFACPVLCRSRVKGPDITMGVAQCVQAFVYYGQSFAYEPQKGYSKVAWQAAKLADLWGINCYEIMGMLEWLTDCYKAGILTARETGLPLNEIGSQKFIAEFLRIIAEREGFGDILAEGCQRAADYLGGETRQYFERHYPRAGNFGGYRDHWVFFGGFPMGYAIPQLALAWVVDTRCTFTSHDIMTLLIGAAEPPGNWYAKPDEALMKRLRAASTYAFGSEKAAEFFTPDGKALNWDYKANVIKIFMERSVLKDSYVVCDVLFPFLYNQQRSDHIGDTSIESRIYSAITGLDLSEEESYRIGDMLITLERAISCRDGRTRDDDVLHGIYYTTKDAAGRVIDWEGLERAKDQLYQLRGWDLATGIPTRQKLEELGLTEVAKGLEVQGILPKNR